MKNTGKLAAFCGDFGDGGYSLTSIAVARTNSNTVYVGSSEGFLNVTTNALDGVGAVWNDRSTGLQPLYVRRFITQVAVDPHISTTAYVAFSSFNFGHVFR